MPDFLAQISGQVKVIWGQLTGGQRLVIFVVLLGVVAILGGAIYYGSQPDMVPLIEAGSGKDLAKIQSIISDQGVACSYESGCILVPRSQKPKLRMLLAKEGITAGSHERGWGILDEVPATATRQYFGQKQLEARSRELELAIQECRGVVSVRIIPTVPNKRLFTEDKKASRVKATVLVTTVGGIPLDRQTADSIRNMVSNGIERLEPENVSLHDGRGKKYDYEHDNGQFALGSREGQLQAKVQGFLDTAYGFGNTIVGITMDLDRKQSELRMEVPDKSSKVPIRTRSTSNSSPSGSGSGGFPSARDLFSGGGGQGLTGTPNAEMIKAIKDLTAATPTKVEETKEEEYEVGKTVTITKDPGGRILRQSVGVSVNAELVMIPEKKIAEEIAKLEEAGAPAADVTKKKDELTKLETDRPKRKTELLADIEASVKSVVDFVNDSDRKDKLSVTFGLFTPQNIVEMPDPGLLSPQNIRLVLQVFGALLVLFFLKGLIKKGQKGGAGVAENKTNIDAGDGEEEEARPDPMVERKRLRKEIEKTVAHDPGAVGRLLAGWLQEK